jgi:uncharacterized protein
MLHPIPTLMQLKSCGEIVWPSGEPRWQLRSQERAQGAFRHHACAGCHDMLRRARCAIAVMTKAPQAGQSKTRLSPPLTLQQAAALSAAFLRDATENIRLAAQTASIAGYVAYAPDGAAHLFDGHLAVGTGLVLADGTAVDHAGITGLGRSLLQAATALLASGHEAVCLLNADSPNLPTQFLLDAAEALKAPGDRMVLGAADDGGYYLIGLKRPHASLFRDIAWSSEQVSRQTLERAAEAGLETVLLPKWFDVDDLGSLHRLADSLTGAGDAPYAAPAVRAWLSVNRAALGDDSGDRSAENASSP